MRPLRTLSLLLVLLSLLATTLADPADAAAAISNSVAAAATSPAASLCPLFTVKSGPSSVSGCDTRLLDLQEAYIRRPSR